MNRRKVRQDPATKSGSCSEQPAPSMQSTRSGTSCASNTKLSVSKRSDNSGSQPSGELPAHTEQALWQTLERVMVMHQAHALAQLKESGLDEGDDCSESEEGILWSVVQGDLNPSEEWV